MGLVIRDGHLVSVPNDQGDVRIKSAQRPDCGLRRINGIKPIAASAIVAKGPGDHAGGNKRVPSDHAGRHPEISARAAIDVCELRLYRRLNRREFEDNANVDDIGEQRLRRRLSNARLAAGQIIGNGRRDR